MPVSGTVVITENTSTQERENISSLFKQENMQQSLENLLTAAAPRLHRFARAQGIPPDSVDDVVQETLLEAWRHFSQLYSPEHFPAWLNGICHNVCLRWLRAHLSHEQYSTPFSTLTSEPEMLDNLLPSTESVTFDLAEELERQDLATLLDRAMSYLPAVSRHALELHYLAELPQREVAQRLELPLNTLEVRLHRARKQLCQILSNQLREDAQAFGLILDKASANDWQPTSLWCILCGHQRMQGKFVPLPGGNFNLCLRCPLCCLNSDCLITQTLGLVDLSTVRSFRPAWKRTVQTIPQFFSATLASGGGSCPLCQGHFHVQGHGLYNLPGPLKERYCLELFCPHCGQIIVSLISSYLATQAALPFFLQHKRCIIDPEQLVSFQGQSAIRVCLLDKDTNDKFLIFAHPETLQVLASFTE